MFGSPGGDTPRPVDAKGLPVLSQRELVVNSVAKA